MKKLLISLLCTVILTSCGTLFCGSRSKVTFYSDNVTDPVDLTVDGNAYPHVKLPYSVKVKRGFKASRVTAETNGYEPLSFFIQKKYNAVTVLNLWNPIAWGIDLGTGAAGKPASRLYTLTFRPKAVDYSDDPTIRAGEAQKMVSRDRPGQTALERTIIRWFFDSDPRGARISWRIVSSIPDIVKNTNETYLMTTPFEETRAFNILGLTYENSRNVQIEIKVSKRGYEDQIKRFNLRQAIDQQEISGFFEMVPKAE